LAKALCLGHNVIVIDKNAEALHTIQESIDIFPMRGDVETSQTYKNLPHKEIDLFIAVTNLDNVNLVAVLMADSVLQIKKKFVRLQKYFSDESIIKERLNIDEIIFPIELASSSISSLLGYPKANNVKFFKYTQHKLISVRVSEGVAAQEIDTKTFKVVGIERDKEFFIPKERVLIQQNDLIYFFGLQDNIRNICMKLELENNTDIKKGVVFGGEELGVSIAKALLDIGRDVKVVDKDFNTCQAADEALEGRATVIHSKYGIHDVFEDEGLKNADIFIAATNNDEYNIIKCLEAKDKGIHKVLAINNEIEYYNLMHSLGIVVVRGPKINAYNKIMEEISSTQVVIQKHFCGAKATVFMRKIFHSSALIGKRVRPLKVQFSAIFYMRDEVLYPFDKKISLCENDLIISFCTTQEMLKVKQWINEL